MQFETKAAYSWSSYNSYDYVPVRGSRPGAINNASLFVEAGLTLPASREVRDYITDYYDYHLVSSPVWTKLVEWYGITLVWQVLQRCI